MPSRWRSSVTWVGWNPPAGNSSREKANSPVLSVLKWISPPSWSTWRYFSRKFRWVSRRLAWRLVGQGSQKLMYSRSTSPGAKKSGSPAASASTKNTFRSPRSRARSMAITMASGTRSTATKRTSGSAAAVSQVKRPLPQPSSTRRAWAPGSRDRQCPRRVWGSRISQSAQASIRGIRFFFLLMRMERASFSGPGPSHFPAIIPYLSPFVSGFRGKIPGKGPS